MLTEIRCEICINHFVEIIFTLSCAVVDINLLQINCSQNFLLKMCKKNCRHPLVNINNINVPGQRICSHFLVKIFLLICYFCILMYNIPTRIFTDLYLKSKRQHFRVFVYKSNLYIFFSYEIAEFRIQELFEPLFKEKWPFSWDTQVSLHCLSFIIWFSRYRFSLYVL